ncbi:energy transducer TonB [bacterium]|nr:energy transducer TonB [bacterium]
MKQQYRYIRPSYKRLLELGLVISLFLHIGLMQAMKRFADGPMVKGIPDLPPVILHDVDRTVQNKIKPAPSVPSVPVPSDDPELPPSASWDSNAWDLDISEIPVPVLPDTGEVFWVKIPDVYPKPVGGWGELTAHIHYPEMARKAGLEGQVVVMAYIDEHGKVIKTEIMRSLTGCDEAAVNAIRNTIWSAAEQQGRKVPVKVAIPIAFKLN